MSSRLPKLVAFDLDYTLWDLWIDTHVDGPLRREGEAINSIVDKNKQPISFYRDIPTILIRLRDANVAVAACSRTHAPRLAREALTLLLIPPKPGDSDAKPERAIDFFDQLEIYPGSKIPHFKQLHKKTGIPYEEMLFFDDEYRNKEVEKLGVTMYHVKDGGVTQRAFEKGLTNWREKHSEHILNDDEQSGT